MATYNWSLRPGIYNYWISMLGPIQDTVDDVRPNNYAYVAIWGNDEIGNGSRLYPFRTIEKASTLTDRIIIGAGVYRENLEIDSNLVADGDVVFDQSFNTNGSQPRLYGIKIRNVVRTFAFRPAYDVVIDGNGVGRLYFYNMHQRNIIKNFVFVSIEDAQGSPDLGYNTFVNISSLVIVSGLAAYTQACLYHSIYSNCNIEINSLPYFDYCLFDNCKFRMNNSQEFVEITNLAQLQSLVQTEYPDFTGFSHCIFADPKFNNSDIGDYSLAFDSPAKNLSYFGTPIGAQSIASAIRVRAIEANGDFDFSSKDNVVVSDNSIKLDNILLAGSITTRVKTNLIGRELGRAPLFAFNADRNGQYINSIKDLSDTEILPSTNLNINTPYLVAGAAITWNGFVIQPGERFTTTNIVDFTSVGGGYCLEILEAPQRHTIKARFSNGGATVNLGSPLISGYWYYVAGTISYNGNSYTDECFKAIDTNSFTGIGTVVEAMADQEFQHYEAGIKFSSNNTGNTRTGEILRGNGDPNYERGTGKEFPINAKFIQLHYIIQPNNLKP